MAQASLLIDTNAAMVAIDTAINEADFERTTVMLNDK